jgi:hypothetical protein
MNNQKIVALEDQLKKAMINSDTAVLDQLLDDELIFTNHLRKLRKLGSDL